MNSTFTPLRESRFFLSLRTAGAFYFPKLGFPKQAVTDQTNFDNIRGIPIKYNKFDLDDNALFDAAVKEFSCKGITRR